MYFCLSVDNSNTLPKTQMIFIIRKEKNIQAADFLASADLHLLVKMTNIAGGRLFQVSLVNKCPEYSWIKVLIVTDVCILPKKKEWYIFTLVKSHCPSYFSILIILII